VIKIASCKYCGTDVSPTAKVCPKCGDSYPGHGSRLFNKLLDRGFKKKKRKGLFR